MKKVFYTLLFWGFTFTISQAQTQTYDNINFNNPVGNENFITGQARPMIYGSRSGGNIHGGSNSLILQAGTTQSNRHIFFRTADETRLFIHNNGRVGIGTSSPESKLHVNGRMRLGIHEFGAGTWLSAAEGSDWFVGLTGSDNFRIHRGSDFLTVAKNGNIGIGTSNPESKLHINGRMRLGLHQFGAGTWLSAAEGSDWFVGLTGSDNFRIHRGSDFLTVTKNGNVSIGTTSITNYRLNVWGRVRAHEIVVNTTGADFVFEEDYTLRPLSEVEAFIKANKHLPEIPSAKEMQEDGVGVSELQTKLLQKIEELTLYMIEQNKQLAELKNENIEIRKENQELSRENKEIKASIEKLK
jgi:hypothetical protein